MSDPTKLWAIHIQGPDTVIAQPDKATAERRAAEWQANIDAWLDSRGRSEWGPTIKHVVIEWDAGYKLWRAEIDEHGGDPEDHC